MHVHVPPVWFLARRQMEGRGTGSCTSSCFTSGDQWRDDRSVPSKGLVADICFRPSRIAWAAPGAAMRWAECDEEYSCCEAEDLADASCSNAADGNGLSPCGKPDASTCTSCLSTDALADENVGLDSAASPQCAEGFMRLCASNPSTCSAAECEMT